ncbi:MAG TPA: acylphosphatase [Planctomycetaceae bacterium]|nr:acylphosphatase [Planctomycetaceae bacterium]
MPPRPPAHAQRRLIYSGRVQGVGFRYTTARIAGRHPVTGYVRNLADGTVELVVDGPAGAVGAFLDEVSATFAEHITDCRSELVDAPQPFSRFEIRR